MRSGWENGQRVPVSDRREMEDEDSEESVREFDPGSLLRRFVSEQLSSNRCLYIECFALALSMCYDGSSEAEIAKRYGVTRAAVSKRCVDITDAFNVPPSRAMRQKKNRESCRKARLLSRSKL